MHTLYYSFFPTKWTGLCSNSSIVYCHLTRFWYHFLPFVALRYQSLELNCGLFETIWNGGTARYDERTTSIKVESDLWTVCYPLNDAKLFPRFPVFDSFNPNYYRKRLPPCQKEKRQIITSSSSCTENDDDGAMFNYGLIHSEEQQHHLAMVDLLEARNH